MPVLQTNMTKSLQGLEKSQGLLHDLFPQAIAVVDVLDSTSVVISVALSQYMRSFSYSGRLSHQRLGQ